MKYNISKELFEAVTNNEGTLQQYNKECIINGDFEEQISVNDLFFMCKEFAFKQGYRLDSATVPKGDFTLSYCIIREWTQSIDKYVKVINADSEQQAVFDACEYIRKELLK